MSPSGTKAEQVCLKFFRGLCSPKISFSAVTQKQCTYISHVGCLRPPSWYLKGQLGLESLKHMLHGVLCVIKFLCL